MPKTTERAMRASNCIHFAPTAADHASQNDVLNRLDTLESWTHSMLTPDAKCPDRVFLDAAALEEAWTEPRAKHTCLLYTSDAADE